MKILTILFSLLLLIPVGMTYADSVINFDELMREAEKKESERAEKQYAEEEAKKIEAQIQAQYLRADWECKSINSLAERASVDWGNLWFLRISADSFSPILSITSEKFNYDLELVYSNGETEKHFVKDYWSEYSLYKTPDNKIESIKLSKLPYTDYESIIVCDDTIIQRADIEKKINEIQDARDKKIAEKMKIQEDEQRQEQERLDTLYRNGMAVLEIRSNTSWNAVILDGNMATNSFDGYGSRMIEIPCGKTQIISLNLQKQTQNGFIEIQLIQKDKILNQARTTAQYGIASVASECLSQFCFLWWCW